MRGRIVQASGGTLFLDEISDMPRALQTRLLRVLEELEVTPLGGDAVIKVNVRIMCASHRDLSDMMGRGESLEHDVGRGTLQDQPQYALPEDQAPRHPDRAPLRRYLVPCSST